MSKKKEKTSKKPGAGFKNEEPRPLESVEVIIRKKILGEAPYEQHFVVADGKRLKNIIELADALETMTEEVFAHHVNEYKNDFSNWIKDVFYDHSLADDMQRAKNKLEAQITILRRLVKELM